MKNLRRSTPVCPSIRDRLPSPLKLSAQPWMIFMRPEFRQGFLFSSSSSSSLHVSFLSFVEGIVYLFQRVDLRAFVVTLDEFFPRDRFREQFVSGFSSGINFRSQIFPPPYFYFRKNWNSIRNVRCFSKIECFYRTLPSKRNFEEEEENYSHINRLISSKRGLLHLAQELQLQRISNESPFLLVSLLSN